MQARAGAACQGQGFRDYFEMTLVLEYERAVPLPPSSVLPATLLQLLETVVHRGLRPLLEQPLLVLIGGVSVNQTQLHVRGVVLTTHALDGWTWAGQLTRDLREADGTEPLLATVRHDQLELTKRPEQSAAWLCRALQAYDELHANVRQQLQAHLTDAGRRQRHLGLQYFGQQAQMTLQAIRDVVDGAEYHKRYLIAVPREQWLRQYDDLLATFLARNSREPTPGFSPAAQEMRQLLERVADVLHDGVYRILYGLPRAYPHLHLARWDEAPPAAPEPSHMYDSARVAWWTRHARQQGPD